MVCDFCPISVFYEDRSPGGLPLPELTVAGWRIVAGESVDPLQDDGPVTNGTANVEFRAPEIHLEEGFTAGPNFLAIADPNTCLNDCDACCDDWGGFTVDTYDPDLDGDYGLNNWFEPDGDGWQDFWQVHDAGHPFCAYGAQAYELTIWAGSSAWGNPVWYVYEDPGGCCPFESRAPENLIEHSSIYWDGTINTGWLNCYGCPVTTGTTYFYVLHLYGCDGEITYTGTIYASGDVDGAPQEPEAIFVAENHQLESSSGHGDAPGGTDLSDPLLLEDLAVVPNPVSDRVLVIGSVAMDRIEVMDLLGRMVIQMDMAPSGKAVMNVHHLTHGEYIIRVFTVADGIRHRKFVKQ